MDQSTQSTESDALVSNALFRSFLISNIFARARLRSMFVELLSRMRCVGCKHSDNIEILPLLCVLSISPNTISEASSDGSEYFRNNAVSADVYYELKLDPDAHTYMRLWRIFRNLAVKSTGTVVPYTAAYTEARESQIDDLIDILALIRHANINFMTLRREEMRPLVNRILGS